MSIPGQTSIGAKPGESPESITSFVYIQTPGNLPFTTTNPSGLVQFAAIPPQNQQNVILAPVKQQKMSGGFLTMIQPDTSGKLVIAPMPKVVKNHRLPVTVTTNSLQPKITFMPLTVPQTITDGGSSAGKTFNFKITDGEIQQNSLLICNQQHRNHHHHHHHHHHQGDNNNESNNSSFENNLRCDEVISLDSPTPPPLIDEEMESENKEYELSILEDSNSFTEERRVPKLLKHGVFILKKNCQSNNNVVEKKIEPEQIASKPQKSERRRKSNFAYRKDYDEIEKSNEIVEKIDECDLKSILKWEEGIGTLPGSDLKFVMNEFNLVEYVTREEYDKIIDKRLSKVKSAEKIDFHDELRCEECGCYGSPSEFINTKYCGKSCQESGNNKAINRDKETKVKKKRKRKVEAVQMAKADSCSDDNNENNTSNENSQDKFSYPWTCTKKGFSWTKYLDHMKVKAAPVKLFKDAFPYNRNGFRPGMKLEGIDPLHPSYFCVLTVAEICGYRMRLHFDGYPDNYDFWLNADSMDVFPVGWCEKHGHTLQPPPDYTVETFNWVNYLKVTKTSAAPKHLFANRAGNAICPNGFRVGMKLEAVDRKNTSLVCVATVRNMMDNRILVHFDSWDDIYDYWADPTSPFIHPVGWCDQYGHNLTPPNDYPNPENFSWNRYLKETKSVAVPVRAFKQRPACGFKRGMRLECVDRRVPQLIRVATVNDVKDHRIRIHFDGWPDRYSYWVDDDHEDIHPVGWCHKTGHPLETPLTPDDVYDFLECPTIGCRGLGHMQGPKYPTHSEQKYCPYAEDNIDVEKVLPDRLSSPDRRTEAVIPVQRSPTNKEKPSKSRLGRPPKCPRLEASDKPPDLDNKPTKRKYNKKPKFTNDDECDDEECEKSSALSLIELSKIDPAEKETWCTHSQFLKDFVKHCEKPRFWSDDKVANFVMRIPGCKVYSNLFSSLEIDGEAFLSLSQKDLIDLLEMKIGPAVKLYNVIVLLRQKSFG